MKIRIIEWLLHRLGYVNFYKGELNDVRNKLSRRILDVRDLTKELADLNKSLLDIHKKLEGNYQFQDDVSFDFTQPGVFSIERMFDKSNNWYKTVIGVILPGKKTLEWSFFISETKHKELIKEFNRVKGIPNGDV
jgi:hypothetical protein